MEHLSNALHTAQIEAFNLITSESGLLAGTVTIHSAFYKPTI